MNIRNIVGIVLIVLSIGGMFFWETWGREAMTLDTVVVASGNITEGSVVGISDFKLAKLPKDTIIPSAISWDQALALSGKVARMDIMENQQIDASAFKDQSQLIEDGVSIFSLPKEWIYSKPAGLRAGDRVSIYLMPSKELLGTFTIAYLRDSAEQAVQGTERGETVLSRNGSTALVSSVEILASTSKYFQIYDALMGLTEEPEAQGTDDSGDTVNPSDGQQNGQPPQTAPGPEDGEGWHRIPQQDDRSLLIVLQSD